MMAEQSSVLVICDHELLGEGLVARLNALGIESVAARTHDHQAIVLALLAKPEVVVLESSDPNCRAQVARLSPTSVVVDAATTVGRGYPTRALPFDAILEALPVHPGAETPRGAAATEPEAVTTTKKPATRARKAVAVNPPAEAPA